MGVQRHWRDYTTGHALSAARVTCEFGSAAYSAAMVGIDEHLREVLARHRVDTGLFSPVRGVQPLIEQVIQTGGGPFFVDIPQTGSFPQGPAVHAGTDTDLFVSLPSPQTATLQRYTTPCSKDRQTPNCNS